MYQLSQSIVESPIAHSTYLARIVAGSAFAEVVLFECGFEHDMCGMSGLVNDTFAWSIVDIGSPFGQEGNDPYAIAVSRPAHHGTRNAS